MNVLGIVGIEAEACATRLHGQRIYRGELRVSDAAKRAGIQQREDKLANSEYLRDEGELTALV